MKSITILINFLILIILLNNYICSEVVDCGDNILCPIDKGNCTDYSNENEGKFCKCFSGYMDDPKEEYLKCSYKQKTQLKAFLLELFLCYGAGHFYIHNYRLAIPKLVVFIFLYCLFIALRIITKAKEENKFANLIICISAGFSFVGMLTWQIIDLVNFGRNKYEDGNKMPLHGWN